MCIDFRFPIAVPLPISHNSYASRVCDRIWPFGLTQTDRASNRFALALWQHPSWTIFNHGAVSFQRTGSTLDDFCIRTPWFCDRLFACDGALTVPHRSHLPLFPTDKCFPSHDLKKDRCVSPPSTNRRQSEGIQVDLGWTRHAQQHYRDAGHLRWFGLRSCRPRPRTR